jgi:hypothetical protein
VIPRPFDNVKNCCRETAAGSTSRRSSATARAYASGSSVAGNAAIRDGVSDGDGGDDEEAAVGAVVVRELGAT